MWHWKLEVEANTLYIYVHTTPLYRTLWKKYPQHYLYCLLHRCILNTLFLPKRCIIWSRQYLVAIRLFKAIKQLTNSVMGTWKTTDLVEKTDSQTKTQCQAEQSMCGRLKSDMAINSPTLPTACAAKTTSYHNSNCLQRQALSQGSSQTTYHHTRFWFRYLKLNFLQGYHLNLQHG